MAGLRTGMLILVRIYIRFYKSCVIACDNRYMKRGSGYNGTPFRIILLRFSVFYEGEPFLYDGLRLPVRVAVSQQVFLLLSYLVISVALSQWLA
jgi:hypothetical protein